MDKEWRKITKEARKTKSAYLIKSVETTWKQKQSGWKIAQSLRDVRAALR